MIGRELMMRTCTAFFDSRHSQAMYRFKGTGGYIGRGMPLRGFEETRPQVLAPLPYIHCLHTRALFDLHIVGVLQLLLVHARLAKDLQEYCDDGYVPSHWMIGSLSL